MSVPAKHDFEAGKLVVKHAREPYAYAFKEWQEHLAHASLSKAIGQVFVDLPQKQRSSGDAQFRRRARAGDHVHPASTSAALGCSSRMETVSSVHLTEIIHMHGHPWGQVTANAPPQTTPGSEIEFGPHARPACIICPFCTNGTRATCDLDLERALPWKSVKANAPAQARFRPPSVLDRMVLRFRAVPLPRGAALSFGHHLAVTLVQASQLPAEVSVIRVYPGRQGRRPRCQHASCGGRVGGSSSTV